MGLRNPDIFLNEPSQFELAAKTLKKNHAPEVSEMGIDKGQIQFLQAFWHALEANLAVFFSVALRSLLVRFVPQLQNTRFA